MLGGILHLNKLHRKMQVNYLLFLVQNIGVKADIVFCQKEASLPQGSLGVSSREVFEDLFLD